MKFKELITKSLFDEIYNCDISKDGDMLSYHNRIDVDTFINDCKKWLIKHCISFTLNYYEDGSVQFYCEEYHLDIESISEIETIIKACIWIMEINK